MDSVEKLIDQIKTLIASGDLSDSIHLRQLHKSCLQTLSELNSNLEKCRELAENGSLQAARELNCSFTPSLTRIADSFEFLKTNDFFLICKDYGLEMPVFPDEKLLTLLNTPVSKGEQHLHVLLQDYRKIARSGTMKQRIALLQQIVKKLPNSVRWRNDLIAAEHTRCQEIQRELESLAGNDDCCQKLEELYCELLSPEWFVPPENDLLEKVRSRLVPLQQARLNKEVELKLQSLQDCYIARDISRLEKEFEQWKIFSTSPLLNLSLLQKQTVEDVEKFLFSVAEERKNLQLSRELIQKIEQQLSDNKPFSEIIGDYNQLQLMDCEIPTALAERLKALEEENKRCESMRSVRRSIYGVCGAAVLIAAVVSLVFYVQHYQAVKRSSEAMKKLFEEKKYVAIINTYDKLNSTSPEVAMAPQVIAMYQKAKDELTMVQENRENAKQQFSSLLKQIKDFVKHDVLDNKDEIDKCLKAAEAIHQQNPQERKVWSEFTDLKIRIISERTQLKEKRKSDFLAFSQKTRSDIQNLISEIPTKTAGELETRLTLLRKSFNNQLADHYVDAQLKDRERKRIEEKAKEFVETLEKEKAFRLVDRPADFEKYLSALDDIRQIPDIAMKYQNALILKTEWQKEYEENRSYVNFPQKIFADAPQVNDYNGLFRTDLEKFLPKQEFTDGFKSFFKNLQKMKQMKEIIFTTSDSREFFFYVSGKVLVENLRNPRRTNISFSADPVGQEKSRRFIFTCSPKNQAPYTLISENRESAYKMPDKFELMNGNKTPAIDEKFFWPGYYLAKSPQSSSGPGMNSYLKKSLLFIHEEGNVKNVYLKEMFFNRFLKELYDSAPQLYCEIDEKLPDLIAREQGRQKEWRAPQTDATYAEEKKFLEEKWKQIDLQRIFKAAELRGDFICSFHARGLLPAGVLRVLPGSKTEIHWFNKTVPPEGFVFKFDIDKKTVVRIPEEIMKGNMPRDKKWKNLLFPGQIIWAFADGMSNRDFIRAWKEKANELNIYLKVKPSILPEDYHL